MQNKNKLKGTTIFIENDMTNKEINIQNELKKIAKQEYEKGNKVRIGYQKLTINSKTFDWEEISKEKSTKN